MDALDRLHAKLLEARRREAPAGGRSFTIADVYQRLVPYRHLRGELGLSELKEYEHVLLRLLSGEREYVRVTVAKVADEFRRELRSPNPILGIYRDYAAVELEVDEAGASAPPALPAPSALSGRAAPVEREDTLDEPERPVLLPPMSGPAVPRTAPAPAPCWSCRAELPAGIDVRFCPFCAAAQVAVPCAECGAEMAPSWRFCAQCGTRRPEDRSPPPGWLTPA